MEIKYYVTNFDDISKVYGFLQFKINNYVYGYCPQDKKIEMEGSELLSNWFEQLAQVHQLIQKHSYVLLNDIDSHNSWLEFKRFDRNWLEISHIKNTTKDGEGNIRLKPLETFEYGLWKNVRIEQMNLLESIYNAIYRFLKEITKENPLYLTTDWVNRISEIMKIDLLDNI